MIRCARLASLTAAALLFGCAGGNERDATGPDTGCLPSAECPAPDCLDSSAPACPCNGASCGAGGTLSTGGTFATGGNAGGLVNPAAGGTAVNPAAGGATATPGAGGTRSAAGSGSTMSTGGTTSDGACAASSPTGHFQMENLSRGVIAVRDGGGNYVGWRMLGHEYDRENPANVAYNVYRDGTLVATVTDSTNYVDEGAPADAEYAVSAVVAGKECPRSEPAPTWERNYVTIPLTPPPAGQSPNGEAYAYDVGTVTRSNGAVNDGSPGDVDGDGDYEVVVIWEPSNAQDNSKDGFTGPVYLDCYELDGTRLWRMNLGPNIRAGAHYTQFLVYDLDGDGRAEVALRTAPGTRDSTGEYLHLGPAANDDDTRDYRNGNGYVLSGPEYLTVFDGATGRELATTDFEIARGSVDAWGDGYGNRVDRFLASVGFVSDLEGGAASGRPALLMARGYYERATVTAWTWRDGELKRIWTADSNSQGSGALAGQGAHSMVVADVDGDRAQEIVYGAAMIQSDGTFGCSTGFGHGDALHVTDLIPSRPGLEAFMPHEAMSKPWWDLRDAETCEVIHVSTSSGDDNGRGVAADVTSASPGAEFWSASDSQLRSAESNDPLGSKPGPINFLIWWDGDELRELEDGTTISKADGQRLFSCGECMSNNYTKATPTLTADLFGDWREEIIWRTPNSSALRVYTTTAVTDRRIYTLMHDPQYRMQVTSEQTAYNQPPHPGFFLGDGMAEPPAPDIHLR